MFYRANPGMTSLPCSCKEIYSRNATEELLHEDKCYDCYGRPGYTNILYSSKEETKSNSLDCEGFSKVFSELKLHPKSNPNVFEFLEMSPWRACTKLWGPHKTCAVLTEKLDISENFKPENKIQRRSISTLEASVTSKKTGKCANRPYSDSKLNENSRKPSNFVSNNLRSSKNSLEDNYKFYHYEDFSKYITGYNDTVTLSRLQGQYREKDRRHGNARAMTTQPQWATHNALHSRKDKDAREVPATNSDLVNRDSRHNTSCERSKDETCYNVHFPSFETSSFKVARCCVHAENKKEKKPKSFRDVREKEDGLGIDDKIQMFCERLSTTNCAKDKRRKSNPKTSKILKKTKMRKLEIVTRPPNETPRKKPSLTTTKDPSRWQEITRIGRRIPSPRIVSQTPLVTKPAQIQKKYVKKCATKSTADQSPSDKVFLEYGANEVNKNT